MTTSPGGPSTPWPAPRSTTDSCIASGNRRRSCNAIASRIGTSGAAQITIDENGDPWLCGFGFGETAAADSVLAADLAQLLAALAIDVGADRAVDTAIEVLGEDTVSTALPLLQPGALRSTTRSNLRQFPGRLDELQGAVAARCGITQPHYAQLERLSARNCSPSVHSPWPRTSSSRSSRT